MQQLMETYFMYVKGTTGDTIRLLFSEKHLCNEMGFAEPFFRKICSKEIENIDKRLNNNNNIESEKELLLSVKEMLLEGQKGEKQEFNLYRNNPANLPCANNTMDQLGQDVFLEFLTNHSDEELYDIYSSKLGTLKGMILSTLNMIELIDSDLVQNLYGLKFVEKDSSKLKKQKKKLLQEIKDCNSIGFMSSFRTQFFTHF